MDERLKFFTDRVQSQYFSDFPLFRTAPNEYAGVFMKHRLNSHFLALNSTQALAQPVCTSPTGQIIDIVRLQGLCRASQSEVVLDRFVRSIHLLNLLCQPNRWDRVYLPVSMGLIAGVDKNHGQVFREILDQLGCAPHQFGILLPEALQHEPIRFNQVILAYQGNGFTTAIRRTDGGISEIARERSI